MHSIDIRPSEKFPEPDFSRLQKNVFANIHQASTEWGSVLADEGSTMGPPAPRHHSPVFRWGAFAADELVGWSYGWMERGNVFYMANSGVAASHRRQGIYAALLNAVREHALAQGVVILRSQHSVSNNPVIIAKLRAGFQVSGLSQSAHMGTLVELSLHLSRRRGDLYRARVLPYFAPPA